MAFLRPLSAAREVRARDSAARFQKSQMEDEAMTEIARQKIKGARTKHLNYRGKR